MSETMAAEETPRRRGRPPKADQRMERIDLRLPVAVYDRLLRLSLRHGVPASVIARNAINEFLSGGKRREPDSTPH